MKKIIFILCVLFGALVPQEAGAIISHRAEINAPSVKKPTTQLSKKDWSKLFWVMIIGSLVLGVAGLLVTVTAAKLIASIGALIFVIAAIVCLIKSL